MKTQPIVHLGVLVMISLLGLTALFFNESNSVGGAVIYDRVIVEEYQSECSDNDPLENYDVKGSVLYRDYRYNDFCSNNKLFQVYCDSSVRVGVTHGYQCLHGSFEGVCLE